ncbi:trigger factor [bacterium]|nr:trigger factor [bacterium]
MKTEIKDIESYKKRLAVEVPTEEVQPYLEKAYRKYQKKVRVDGFRQGKVPLSLIKKRFGKAIQADVADDLVQEFYTKTIEAENISPVAPGIILDVKYQEGQSLKFTAEVEVEPEITVQNYTGIKIEKEIVPVIEEDVQAMLEYLREQRAEKNEVQGGAEKGFLLEADIQALDDTGFPIVGQKYEKHLIEMGKPPFGPDVEEQLVGIQTGEERRVQISVPGPDKKDNRPLTQRYLIKVHRIMEKVMPALDDDFAKSLGEYEHMDQLKNQLKENLQLQRDKELENTVRHRLSQEIVKRNDYSLPPAQIENTLNMMFEEEQKRNQSDVNKDQFLQHHRPMVVFSIKWDRIWHKIAENESIEITDEAIEAEIDRMVKSSPEQEKRIRAQFKSDKAKNRIREQLLEDQVLAFLISESKIKEVTRKPGKKKKSSIIT